tara:strand:+ start:1241 stop:1540 length:300 start_codon:yes stop_codon:yes gene_type:complete
MSDDLVKRLRSMHWCVTTLDNGVGVSNSTVAAEAADRIKELEAKLAVAVEALGRIAYASDVYGVEANAEDQGAGTLAYAHKSTCNLARATLAELKGEQP